MSDLRPRGAYDQPHDTHAVGGGVKHAVGTAGASHSHGTCFPRANVNGDDTPVKVVSARDRKKNEAWLIYGPMFGMGRHGVLEIRLPRGTSTHRARGGEYPRKTPEETMQARCRWMATRGFEALFVPPAAQCVCQHR